MSYVLIHGGTTTGRYWDRVIPFLDGPALAPNLPGRLDEPGEVATMTVTDGAKALIRQIEASPFADRDDLVIVAHSSGGLETPEVVEALGPDRIRAIVLNAASVPPEGGNGFDCMQERHRGLALEALAASEASGQPIVTPKPEPERMRTTSGDELSDEDHAFAADPVRLVEDSFVVYKSPVHWSKTAGIPTTYIVNTRDRAVPPDLQREMASHLPGEPDIIDLDSGHLPAVTQPQRFAELVHAARRR